MGYDLGYTDPSKSGEGDFVILPPREHPVRLTGINLEDDTFNPGQKQFKWSWTGVKYKDPQSGKSGIISLWTGLNYGSPKAKMTALLNSVFGRSLSEDEARRLDIEKLVNVVEGYAMVAPSVKGDGSAGSKWSGFRLPDGRPPYKVEDFLKGSGTGDARPSSSAPADASASSAGGDFDDFEDDGDDPFKD